MGQLPIAYPLVRQDLLILSVELVLFSKSKMSCFVMECDQTITGRNFEYDEALKIVQFEEYTEDVDFDEIKRYDVQKRSGYFKNKKLNPRKGRKHKGKNPRK